MIKAAIKLCSGVKEIWIDKNDVDEVLKLDYMCYKKKQQVNFYYMGFEIYIDPDWSFNSNRESLIAQIEEIENNVDKYI